MPDQVLEFIQEDTLELVLQTGDDLGIEFYPEGAQGQTGPAGATGSAGAAATVSVGTVTTGAPGSSAIVTNSGTTSAAILDFTIPEGDVGATGSPGANGQGVPTGGTANQVLAKIDGTNYNTQWVTNSASATWGAITGTLSSQTDLQSAIDAKVADNLTASTTVAPSKTAVNTALALKLDANVAITGATKTKVTYDADGLITSGADATTADIADSSNRRYVTDAQLTVIGNTSGTNTGDQTNITGNAATVTTNANLTGHITSTGNAAVLGSFTVAQLNTALSDGDIATGGGSATGTNTGDNAVNTLYSGLVSNATHTGDATGSTALTVVRINGVSMAGLATGILKNTTGTGAPSIAVNSDLPAMSATVGGAVPTPPNNTTDFLRGDGTWATPAGGSGLTQPQIMARLSIGF